MHRFGILLDLANSTVIVDGTRYQALTSDKDTLEQACRSASRVVDVRHPLEPHIT